MKLAHYDDGKHKWMSHEVFLKEDDNFYCKEFDLFSHNITDVRGYGETKGEALQDLKNKKKIPASLKAEEFSKIVNYDK